MTPPSRSPRRGKADGSSRTPTVAERVLDDDGATLLDLVDNVLSKGVVLTGELTIALAQVDLVYARLSLLLCAADRILPGEDSNPVRRRHTRHEIQRGATRRGTVRGDGRA